MSYLTLIITLPLSVFAVLFAVSNAGDVTLGLWPLENRVTLSVSVFGLVMLGVGFFLGALFVWLHSQKLRFMHWKQSRRAAKLEKELGDLHKKNEAQAAADVQASPSPSQLALPPK